MHSDRSEQAALETLLLPLNSGVLAWPRRVAFLRARPEASLPRDRDLVCEQTFKPEADALQHAGYEAVQHIPANAQPFDLVMVLPPRQREESRSLLARAMQLV